MLRALSGREPPEAVTRLFYSDTEGNPFFVEELFRHLVEQGKLIDESGEFRPDLRIDNLDGTHKACGQLGDRPAPYLRLER